jgi:hypothetical protein
MNQDKPRETLKITDNTPASELKATVSTTFFLSAAYS